MVIDPKLLIINSKPTWLFKNIIVPQQHGFCKNSTVINRISFKQFILNSFSIRQQTDVIFTDFEIVFDIVDHKLLILK